MKADCRRRRSFTVAAVLALCLTALGQIARSAENVEIIRSSIAAGGHSICLGGPFELAVTIGQPIVGTTAGGRFVLTFGILATGSVEQDEVTCNGLEEFAALPQCLLGPQNTVASECAAVDLDNDGDVDLADYAEFQKAFCSTH